MKRIALAVVAALGLALGSGAALAQHSGGGHSGGGHSGGGGGGAWHGGGHGDLHGGHGGFHGGTHIAFGFGFPGYWGVGFGYPYYAGYPYYSSYPYYASYPYYYPYSSGYTSYYSDDPGYAEPGSGTYIQRDMNSGAPATQGMQRGEGQYSYYCPDPAGYYPQVPNCAKGWLKVVPDNSARPPR